MITRHLHTLKLYFIKSPMKRALYMKRKGVFHSMGDRVMITSRRIPLYAKLISIGNNVWMASGVEFITHDVTHFMLNGIKDNYKYTEKIGCIEIENNVFIGADTKILYNVKVGDNVIIAAGALVNKDVPSNSVWGGVPARFICSFEDYLQKRRQFTVEHPADNANQFISEECENEMWTAFRNDRISKGVLRDGKN